MLTWDRVLTEGPRKESSYLESAKQELQSLVREKERPERLHHNYVTDFRAPSQRRAGTQQATPQVGNSNTM